jgi:hypothetical protein
MKKAVFWDIKPQFLPHSKHYFFATEASRLMLCKILGIRGGDYAECRLLEYKNPVRPSHETHYVSVAEHSRLMLCKIEVFTAVIIKNAIFSDMKTQFVPHRKHYFFATEPSRLMLCKI